ncbi:unnamed protein product [Bursaphelenchus okinawaensis]|uniref:Transforming acidic coiled-coil-containing protein C-terminal domain-containing protein n=1 Tax=Bursaphelenchus okinawaensis TaxID=465554 RepID=A0A811KUZ5_9BILA|nr:unnamed protein product [Bursaphelenchus okinawaensis]CAG9111350.1 unnamed protein product [Bursaphelenchus okinawaensis]
MEPTPLKTNPTSRDNSLNRTMVVSKKSVRPALPELNKDVPVDPNDSKSQPPKRTRTSTVTLNTDDLNEEYTMERIRQEMEESLAQKENFRERVMGNPMEEMIKLKFQLQMANNQVSYADKFFAACEKHGIDIAKVLQSDPDTMFELKLKGSLLTPTSSEEHAKELKNLKAERDHLADEAKSLKMSYTNLFKSYEKLRTNYDLLRESRTELADTVTQQREAMTNMYKTSMELKEQMLEQVAEADRTVAETKGKYDSDTVTIRMDLVKLENENKSLKSEIEGKNNEIAQLRTIVQDIIKQINVQVVE